jgi:hypothetical protein
MEEALLRAPAGPPRVTVFMLELDIQKHDDVIKATKKDLLIDIG